MIPYSEPRSWIRYDPTGILEPLVDAKAAVMALSSLPYQKQWLLELGEVQLKREVAGTSRIEGAEFTEPELDLALSASPEGLATRSQRQARAAMETYRWMGSLPADLPVDGKLIREIHRRLVRGADDDHCAPGELRHAGHNVNFGMPRHRGAEGGDECSRAFDQLVHALATSFRSHDALVQALAAHYHIAAIHPFGDGNGRTARAIEAFLLRRAGLSPPLFIAMSNYYYDEKPAYLAALAAVRAGGDDLGPFLAFGLRGVATQSRRLFDEIRREVAKTLYRDVMHQMFGRLRTPKKRVIAKRQLDILETLLREGDLSIGRLQRLTSGRYRELKNPERAFFRDLTEIRNLRAVGIEGRHGQLEDLRVHLRLEWPTEVTQTEFFERIRRLPEAKTRLLG